VSLFNISIIPPFFDRICAMTTTSNPDANALEALRLLGPDPDNWVPDRAGIDHNVVIVPAPHSRSRCGARVSARCR
jgi:hypothetical protein